MLKLLSAIGQYFLLLGKVIQKPQKRFDTPETVRLPTPK